MSRQPSIDRSPERDPTPVEQAALGWVVRCERGLNATEEQALVAWLAADPQHRELFAEFGGTWAVMGRVGELELAAEARERGDEANVVSFAAPAAAQDSAPHARARVPRPGRVWVSLAAAAALALAVTGWWRTESRDSTIATEVGGSRKLILSDGSVVALNTDSAVVTAFAKEERRVKLEKGEAFFQVAKDASRPFVVEAAGVGVRAVGTAFNVRVHPAAIEVIVTEGVVRVAPNAGLKGEFAELSAGHRVMVPIAPAPATAPVAPEATAFAVASVPADELQRKLAWQGGRLDFSDTALGEMVAEFNRYNRRKIVVPDAELAATRFGGSFRPDDRVGFVRILHDNFGIVAEERDGETILHAAPH